MIIGYARVSADGQTLDAQQGALAAAGAEKVFSEKASGAVTDRKALARAIAALGQGDVPLGWIGSPAPRGTSSTSSMRSAKPGPGFDRSQMLGPTRQQRMAG